MFFDFWERKKVTAIGKKIVILTNKRIIKIIKKFGLSENSSFLEIGAGKAVFANILLKQFPDIKYVGIEPNKKLCNEAKQMGLNIMNIKIPPIPKKIYNKFDVVYMSHVLEHFINYEIVLRVLEEIKKCLKNKGRLIIFSPDWLDNKEDYFNCDYTHSFILTELRIKQILTDAGFKILKIISFRGFFQEPYHYIFVYLFHKFIKFFVGILYIITKKEIFFKMKVTFGKNILVIAEKM